jgi:tetratricopeptide (TPR) repeat protein
MVTRIKGPYSAEADLRYLNEAIDEAVARPHRLTATTWSLIEDGAKLERVRRGMPAARSWFMRPQPRVMYDAASRVNDAGHTLSPADLAAMMRDAPYDHLLASAYLTARFSDKPPYDEIIRTAGVRRDYDLRVLRLAREQVVDDAERLVLLRRSCEVSSAECIALAAEHASRNRDDEAASCYERAFADPSLDAVAISNASGWLVSHYLRTRKVKPALQLAEQSARTGSFKGLLTLASLYERLERWDEAEKIYGQAASRYNNPSPRLGFYYRAVQLHRQAKFEPAWKKELAAVFPQGLTTVARDRRPQRGVVVSSDNDLVRRAGLQSGDIIIGVEGWRVDDYRQYSAVNAFFDHDVVKLTAWRGRPFEVTLRAPDRWIGVELRTYPTEAGARSAS